MRHHPTRFARLAALCLGLLPLAACAGNEHLLDVQVVDADQGGTLWPTRFQGRDYIAGAPGHRFSVAMQNLTGERVLAVLSVDGINAISGQTAGASQAGYVLDPWQRVEIRGWRKSYSDVAEFYFTDLPDSYGARTGRPDNVGVIGVAAFRERPAAPIAYAPPSVDPPGPPPTVAPGYPGYPPYASSTDAAEARRESGKASGNAAAAPSAQAADAIARGPLREAQAPAELAARQQLGTGHGERRYAPVAETRFERDSARPNQRVALFYDAYEALAARGVFGARQYATSPNPFPGGFVPDP